MRWKGSISQYFLYGSRKLQGLIPRLFFRPGQADGRTDAAANELITHPEILDG